MRTFQTPLPDTTELALRVEPFNNPSNTQIDTMETGNRWAIASPLWYPVKYNT